MSPIVSVLRDERARVVVLLTVLAALGAYALAQLTAPQASGSVPVAASGCSVGGAERLASVPEHRLVAMGAELARLVGFDRALRPYEAGPVPSAAVWSDAEPGRWTAGGEAGRRVDGSFEMRWWLPNGDDLAGDVMVFQDPGRARDFLRQAGSSHCRAASAARRAASPPNGRNVEWLNPDGFAQQDVFIARGRSVYRVAVVKAGVGSEPTEATALAGFAEIDRLACLLPAVGCVTRSGTTVTRSS